ncbi:hypothetical protein L2E82_30680 [Cichorium intybus]|uniref:Uncharacterized protein n=1 Tax=Cichorium intybus TaxID=13427 RepID=A0ACB9D1D8_CICIN|nr:hypothetical protein L2E82_30680 [Cichorium intybus]
MGFYVQALILMLLAAKILLSFVGSVPQVPCFFIFGDSLMDNGNNNNLVTEAKANYPPYGIDLLDGPTGRFSNGRNIADVVAQLLGFENSIPPFATVKREEIVRGVNYASGAAGILDKTAEHLFSVARVVVQPLKLKGYNVDDRIDDKKDEIVMNGKKFKDDQHGMLEDVNMIGVCNNTNDDTVNDCSSGANSYRKET